MHPAVRSLGPHRPPIGKLSKSLPHSRNSRKHMLRSGCETSPSLCLTLISPALAGRCLQLMCDLNHRRLRPPARIFSARAVYTVRVRGKGAFFMLAIVVLWATLPGLACFAPAPHDTCCQQMMMQGCGPSMAIADPSCCKVHSSDTTVPPAQASRPEGTSQPAAIFNIAKLALDPLNGTGSSQLSETPPGTPPSSRNSILRI